MLLPQTTILLLMCPAAFLSLFFLQNMTNFHSILKLYSNANCDLNYDILNLLSLNIQEFLRNILCSLNTWCEYGIYLNLNRRAQGQALDQAAQGSGRVSIPGGV